MHVLCLNCFTNFCLVLIVIWVVGWGRLSIVEAELKIRTNLLKYLKLQSGLCSGCGLYIVINYALYTVCVWISSCLPDFLPDSTTLHKDKIS